MDVDYKNEIDENDSERIPFAQNLENTEDEDKETRIIAQIDSFYNNFNRNLLNSYFFIYNVCRTINENIRSTLKDYNFSDLIVNSIISSDNINIKAQGMISLGVYYIAFPSFIDHSFISNTSVSFISINEITPELVEYIKGHLLLVNSFVTSYDLLKEIDNRFYSALPLYFLHPLLIKQSKYILSILTQSVKILSSIEDDEKDEIFNNICNDVVSASLSTIKHDSKSDYTQERTHLLLLIVHGNLINKENVEIQNAFNNVILFENPNLKYIFDIVNATENFDNLYDDLIIQAFEALASEITEESDTIRISAMKLMTKLLEKDPKRFSSIFLCDDSIEYIQDIINIINNGTVNEFKHAGKLLSFIMQRFPQLFAKEIWWTTNDPNAANLPNAIDKFILYKQSRTQSFFLGLECIASFMRIENIDSQPFIEALVNIGIKEKMEEYINDDPEDELAPFVYEDLFGQ